LLFVKGFERRKFKKVKESFILSHLHFVVTSPMLKGRPGRLLVATPDYCWLRMPIDRGRYEDMTPRLVLNYECYTYRNDYDAVIQLPKVASEAGVSCTPVPSLCPTGRDGTPSPL
jgi:hypothetical protein